MTAPETMTKPTPPPEPPVTLFLKPAFGICVQGPCLGVSVQAVLEGERSAAHPAPVRG